MLSNLMDKIGEWNPQLFRELKGRLTVNSLLAVFFFSIFGQFVLNKNIEYSSLEIINWVFPFILIMGGVYLLSKDLAQEEYNGTMNFVRLSPQSSESILWGKMLGVPILIYLGIALATPWYFVRSATEGNNLLIVLGNYFIWGVECYLFYNLAISYTLLLAGVYKSKYSPSAIAGTTVLLSLFTVPTFVSLINYCTYEGGVSWFFIPLDKYPLMNYFWLILSLGGLSHVIWQSNNRRFRSPNITPLSKAQSYGLIGALNFWILGFFVRNQVVNTSYEGASFWLLMGSPILSLFILFLISPNRQSLLDWARYRNYLLSQDAHNAWQDLFWGEKSPVWGAMAVNMMLPIVIWLPWLLLAPKEAYTSLNLSLIQILIGLGMNWLIVLIHTVIYQIMLLTFPSKSQNYPVGITISLGMVPLVIGIIFAAKMIEFPLVWMFSPLPALALFQSSTLMQILGVSLQITVLAVLMKQLNRKGGGISFNNPLCSS